MKPKKSNRTRSYYRHQRKRVIERKKKVVDQGYWFVPNEQYGRLAKGKVHCSCPMCSQKTARYGFPKSQLARLEAMNQDIRNDI